MFPLSLPAPVRSGFACFWLATVCAVGAPGAPALPFHFEENLGQFSSEALFASRGPASTLFLACSEAVLRLDGDDEFPGAVLRLGFGDANNPCEAQGRLHQSGRAHYLRDSAASNWITDVSLYSQVRYEDVHPGVDLVFYGAAGGVEYDFVVAPGADPDPIRLRLTGADSVTVDRDGNLAAALGERRIVQAAPVAYQMDADGRRRRLVKARWQAVDDTSARFELGVYDPSLPLVIDPVIRYSTYLDGSSTATGVDIAVDDEGFAYVVGSTRSMDFPTTAGVLQPNAREDSVRAVFVAKLARGGEGLVFATYIADEGNSEGFGVAIGPDRSVYVVGAARGQEFPVTEGAFDTEPDGDAGFVARLSPDGSRLVYSTFLGDGETFATAVAVDQESSAYITGRTSSPDYPVASAVQPTESSQQAEAFITQLSPDGSSLVFSTFWGGPEDEEHPQAITLDENGGVYVAGWTDSSDLPTTPGVFQPATGGSRDGFVVKLAPGGRRVEYATYLGGSNRDEALDIAVDVYGNAYVAGETGSRDGTFPVTAGAFKQEPENTEGFVTKINRSGSELVYSTFVGGQSNETLRGIAVDTAGHAYVVGDTTALDRVTEINPAPGAVTGGARAPDSNLFAKLRVDSSAALTQFGFGGGDGIDEAEDIAVDGECQAYTTGATRSKNYITVNPLQAQSASEAGSRDAFVTKIDPSVEVDEPAIGCRGVTQATGTPVLREGTAGSIMTVFGSGFTSGAQALAPVVDSQGRVSSVLANTCVEVGGVRSPMFAALPGQANFQNPHTLQPGWVSYRVIRGCGTANEIASEPENLRIVPAAPAFFNFVNNADGVNPIAALHQDGASLVGPPGLFGGAAETTPAAPGEFVSLFAGGFGATSPSFDAGEVPGRQAPLATSDVRVTVGGIPVPPEDIFYIGAAPCCAGLYQLVVRIPPNAPTGNHAVIVTIDGRASIEGPFVAVGAP